MKTARHFNHEYSLTELGIFDDLLTTDELECMGVIFMFNIQHVPYCAGGMHEPPSGGGFKVTDSGIFFNEVPDYTSAELLMTLKQKAEKYVELKERDILEEMNLLYDFN